VFTSLRKAREYRDRGRAVFLGDGMSIRFLDSAEVLQNRQVRVDLRHDEQYWDEVAQQRGGTADHLHYIIRKSSNRPTMPGGPAGAAIMEFIPVMVK